MSTLKDAPFSSGLQAQIPTVMALINSLSCMENSGYMPTSFKALFSYLDAFAIRPTEKQTIGMHEVVLNAELEEKENKATSLTIHFQSVLMSKKIAIPCAILVTGAQVRLALDYKKEETTVDDSKPYIEKGQACACFSSDGEVQMMTEFFDICASSPFSAKLLLLILASSKRLMDGLPSSDVSKIDQMDRELSAVLDLAKASSQFVAAWQNESAAGRA